MVGGALFSGGSVINEMFGLVLLYGTCVLVNMAMNAFFGRLVAEAGVPPHRFEEILQMREILVFRSRWTRFLLAPSSVLPRQVAMVWGALIFPFLLPVIHFASFEMMLWIEQGSPVVRAACPDCAWRIFCGSVVTSQDELDQQLLAHRALAHMDLWHLENHPENYDSDGVFIVRPLSEYLEDPKIETKGLDTDT